MIVLLFCSAAVIRRPAAALVRSIETGSIVPPVMFPMSRVRQLCGVLAVTLGKKP
jgi:hypothetical protein